LGILFAGAADRDTFAASAMTPTTILWVYIVLLFLGGLFGFLKAGSKPSLITSAVFAAVLALCNAGVILQPRVADVFADVVLALLLVFFSARLAQKRKFMPAGLMAVLTLVTLVLRHV
jgi:uncharacterized membrane protein (UPF0136 family)